MKGHDRFDSLGGPSAPWPADGLACIDGRRARQGSGGAGAADSAEAGSSSRAGAAADGRRGRPRRCGQAARRARADSLEMEEALPTRKSRGTTFGCPSIGTSAFSLSETDCAKIVAEACRPPQDVGVPVARWSEHLFGDYLRAQGFELSDSTVGRILRGAMLQPHRQKMWVGDLPRRRVSRKARRRPARLLRHAARRAHHLRRRENRDAGS
jgi:hypothetical protein